MIDRVPAWIAEAVGTAAVVVVAVLAAVLVGSTDTPAGLPDAVVVSSAVAIAYAAAVAGTLSASGGHLNPAVTVAALATGRVDGRTAGRYLVAQVVASVAVGVVAWVAIPAEVLRAVAAGAPTVRAGMGVPAAMVVEAGMALLVAGAYWAVAWTGRGRVVGGLAVGGVYLLVGAVAAPWTGGVANPARALGPLLAAASVAVPGTLEMVPLYTIGPVVGALVAATVLDLGVGVPRPRQG